MLYTWLNTMTLAELQALQATARAAFERLVFGGAVRVFVDQNGERVEYTVSSRQELASYLAAIALAISGKQGCMTPPVPRPLGFLF